MPNGDGEEGSSPADEDAAEGVELDADAIYTYLTAGTAVAAEGAWPGAEAALRVMFDEATWGVGHDVNRYGENAHANLYNVESQRSFKTWLEEAGVTIERYAAAVGELQYVAAQVYLERLFPRARSNTGWRLSILGFPAIGVVALGLGSHYQGTQNHNQMGRASSLMHAQAREVLPEDLRALLEQYPAATADEWEERGLMPYPILSIGDLDISEFDGGEGAKLRMIRNTTVKKELATFFAIKGMTSDGFRAEGTTELDNLRRLALALGTDEGQE